MSVLRVLTVGENPNILLYTSRFNLASSVELYHVSSIPSDTFQITTNAYGTETCRLRYKFDSVNSLIKYIRTNVPGEGLVMDLIILSASTLQEVNTIVSQLFPLVNNTTKIFLESTGFVQLESFVRLSTIRNKSQVSIFSLLTDFDMRASGPCQYEQFNTKAEYSGGGDNNSKLGDGTSHSPSNTIYLGDSTSPSRDQYDQTTATLLRTFKRLFQKLFTSEIIDLCNLSPREYSAKQWLFAIPNICFNPLMIFLEKSSAKKLIGEILAKPLISGLISETTQVIRQTGVTLRADNGSGSGSGDGRVLQTEAELTEYWLDLYSGENQIPALLYHYIKKTAPLNSDITLLQVILLADTFKIRTPYLEFLYTAMTQYERINAGKSKWVERVGSSRDGPNAEETAKSMKELATRMTSERDKYLLQVEKLTKEREAMSDRIDSLTQREYNLTEQVRELQEKLTALENDRDKVLSEQKDEIANLQRELQKLSVTSDGMQQPQQQTSAYKTTGTPNLTDLTDMALFGAKLADSKAGPGSMLTPTVAPTPANYGKVVPQTSQPQAQPRSTGSGRERDTRYENESNSSESEERMLKERELELREKELELQERELELQKRSMDQQQRMQKMNRLTVHQQQQLQPQYPPHMVPAQQAYPNPSRKSSYNQLQNMQLQQQHQQQQQQYMQHPRPGRALHGAGNASQMAMQSASHFVDPVGSGVAYMNGSYNQHPNPHQSVMMGKQPNLPTMPQIQPHAFKATSRKNKNNGLAMLGNASSVSVDTYSTPNKIQPQNRLNSLPGQNVLNPYSRQPRSVTPGHDKYRTNSAMTMGVNPYNNNRSVPASTTGATNVGPGWSNATS